MCRSEYIVRRKARGVAAAPSGGAGKQRSHLVTFGHIWSRRAGRPRRPARGPSVESRARVGSGQVPTVSVGSGPVPSARERRIGSSPDRERRIGSSPD
eukprot:805361-Pyramimonas_sp.AAC.1